MYFQTKSSGNCMFHAFKGCLQVRHSGSKDAVYFPCRYLRMMIVLYSVVHTRAHARTHAHLATAVKQLQSEGMFNSSIKI